MILKTFINVTYIFRNGNLCLSLFSSCWRSSLIPLTFNTKCRETVWSLTQCLIFYEGSFLKRVDGSSLTKWPQFSIIYMLWALRKVLITQQSKKFPWNSFTPLHLRSDCCKRKLTKKESINSILCKMYLPPTLHREEVYHAQNKNHFSSFFA